MSSRAATLNISEPSSIYRLPPELLMPILCHARQRLQDIRFAHVCRHWRTLLLATPEYWVSTLESLKIAPYTPVGLVMHCLTLSSPRPTKVQVIFMGQTERQLLAPHASRIAQLSILGFMGEAAVQAFEGLLKDSLLALTNLRYDCGIPFLGSARTAVHPLSDFPLPSLRHLEIPSSFPSEVVALAVALPRLPPSLERSAWGRPWAGSTGDTGSGTFELPCALRRLELLGGMSDSAKVRLARGFVRASGGVDRPPSRELTLCWVLDVARGFACEERAGDELRRLGKLLEEFDSEGCRLGRLELYGTLQSWVIATRVGEVSTNARRCAEVAGSLLPHFEELVDVVVLM